MARVDVITLQARIFNTCLSTSSEVIVSPACMLDAMPYVGPASTVVAVVAVTLRGLTERSHVLLELSISMCRAKVLARTA